MGKFAIACPECGAYATAYNGLRGLFQNKIRCGNCDAKIHVRAERLTSMECPHCENTVVYDQGEENPLCPVCHKELVSGAQMIPFRCGSCGFGLMVKADKLRNAESWTCPICENRIDVKEITRALAQDRALQEGMISVIEFEGDNNTLVWKHQNEKFAAGSQLIVQESQEAIFFKDGRALDTFLSGRYVLNTKTLPMISQAYGLEEDDPDITFSSKIYFVNLTNVMNVKWGTPDRIGLQDAKTGLFITVGANGVYNLRIIDARRVVIKLVGTTDGLLADRRKLPEEGGMDSALGRRQSRLPGVADYFRETINSALKSALPAVIRQEQIDLYLIDEHLEEIAKHLRIRINEKLAEYGVELTEFYIKHISTPEDDVDDPDHEAYIKRKKQRSSEYIHDQDRSVEKKRAQEKREDRAAAREDEKEEIQAESEMDILRLQNEIRKKRLQAEADADVYRTKVSAQSDAYRMQNMAEADAYLMKARAEAEEMRQKGYTYQDALSRDVVMGVLDKDWSKLGASGDIGATAVKGMASAIGKEMGVDPVLTGEASTGIWNGVDSSQNGKLNNNGGKTMGENGKEAQSGGPKRLDDTWDCPECGQKGIRSRFCPECGCKRPVKETPDDAWDCPECGQRGIRSRFCPECGCKKPEPWDCPVCGRKGLFSKCCPECGTSKPQPWDCPSCGQKKLFSKWCPECGFKKPDAWQCPQCGATVTTGNFCPLCGQKKGEER